MSTFSASSIKMPSLTSNVTPDLVSQDEVLMQTLRQFYKNETNLNIMLEIITGKSNLSLRIIDWFVTNYSKKNNIGYVLKNGNRFKVFISYKLHLQSFLKNRFDPFCRCTRICLPYKEDQFIETTIGQLNFFRWVIENDILDYIQTHHDEIERDMKSRGSISKRKDLGQSSDGSAAATTATSTTGSSNKTRKKREELSVSATKHIIREDVEITIKFS